MTDAAEVPKKRRAAAWLFWWQIDKAQLEKNVAEYETISFFRSARFASAAVILFSIAVTVFFIQIGSYDSSAYLDAGLMAFLAIFICFGHRWALIAAMVLWTVEKIFAIADHPGGSSLVINVIWWCIYMHVFYMAFRIERERRKRAKMMRLSQP